jgi:hypothetical protein
VKTLTEADISSPLLVSSLTAKADSLHLISVSGDTHPG